MRQSLFTIGILAGTLLVLQSVLPAHGHKADAGEGEISAPKLETLLRTSLEGVDGTEVIVSRVTIPPHTALPKHWHPGEEFAYVLDGSVTLWQEGEEDVVFKVGEAGQIPLQQVHTAITMGEGATILVFRVHEVGKPERVLVEDQ